MPVPVEVAKAGGIAGGVQIGIELEQAIRRHPGCRGDIVEVTRLGCPPVAKQSVVLQVAAIEATEEATMAYNEFIKQGMDGTVWLGGCQSWYFNEQGVPIVWPYTWQRWVNMMQQPVWEDFVPG